MNENDENNENVENIEHEEKLSRFVECPHCYTKVIPLAHNICPACRSDMSDLEGVDPNRGAFVIHESEELPTYCFSCDRYTEIGRAHV